MTQFSELHDASSKPWTQLSSFTALVFLLLTQSCSGLSQVVGPSQPVLATVGVNVLLSCRLEPADDASGMSIEWSRDDLDPSYVYVWWDREEMESSKHPDYKGRTSLVFSQLKFGNISLKLSNVTQADKGKYKCMIRPLGRGCTVELVVGTDPIPVISLAGLGRTSGSVELQCESAGWYPEPPEVLWLDADGNLLSAGPTETVRGPDGFYTVSSRVTVEKKHSNKFTCRVQQNNINQSREALREVTDDFFEVQSSNTSTTVGLTASLTAAFILVITVVFLFVRTRRQKNYGNIMDVETTGASEETGQQDQLGFSGVRASHTMAEMDSARMKKYKSKINAVGRKYNIEPALIAAIISRQSRARNVLQDGWGAYSTWGLMQVYVNPDGGGHEARGAWDSKEHLCQGTEILVSFIVQIRNKFPSWTREQQLKGGIAAYMTGDGKVNSYENVDENTACKDFSNDVIARAQWYKKNFF